MSISLISSRVSSLQNDIERIQRTLADAEREIASHQSRIATIHGSINRNTSASTLQSKQREIASLRSRIANIQQKKARASQDLARKTSAVHRAQQNLSREQPREQPKLMDSIRASSQRPLQGYETLIERVQGSGESVRSHAAPDVCPPQWDAFISHASEDKDELVRPLADALKMHGHAVWYDEFQLSIGDKLRRSIDRGLANSRFGIVVLSPSFFAKNWTQYELDGLVQREMAGENDGKVILPLWHKVSKDEVRRFSASLADTLALSTTAYSVEELAEELSAALNRR